jgi:hypothetical protein
MVLEDEIHERLTYHHAHLERLTGVLSSPAAGAIVNCYVRWSFEHQIPRHRIGDDLFQVTQ